MFPRTDNAISKINNFQGTLDSFWTCDPDGAIKAYCPRTDSFNMHMTYVPHTTSQIPDIPDEQLTRGTRPGVDTDPQ